MDPEISSTDSSAIPSKPFKVHGGCLCGAIRYSIDYTQSSAKWPPASGVCQCTMCRKASGSPLPVSLLVPRTLLYPALNTFPMHRTFRATNTATRSFCGTCGSQLTFEYDATPDEIYVGVGTVDEDILLGPRLTKDEGAKRDLSKSLARALMEGEVGHIYECNTIPGLTDHVKGQKS